MARLARINLLPWREAARKRRQTEFGILALAGLAGALLIGSGIHYYIEEQIGFQVRRNDFLQREIAQMDLKIKEIEELEKTKTSLLARMNVIQQLQESRPEIVRMFDELVNTLPEGLYLTELSQTGRTLKLVGRAQSNARVSAYMRNIDNSEWLGKADLKKIEQKAEQKKSGQDKDTVGGMGDFMLNAQQINKRNPVQEDVKEPPTKPTRKGSPKKAAKAEPT